MTVTAAKEYEPSAYIKTLSPKAKQRYMKIHAQQMPIRKAVSRRRGKAYLNFLIRLPKRWCEGLEFEHHDNFEWSIISYDPVILQLRKLESGDNTNVE